VQVDVSPDETFASLLQKVQNEVFTGLRYAQPGISSAEYNRSCNVLLNYVHATFPDFDGMPTKTDWVHPGYGDSSHALRLQIHDFDQSDNLSLQFELNEEVFEPTHQRRVVEHFLNLLDAFLVDRGQSISRIDLLSPEERQAIQAFSQAIEIAPAHQTAVEQFEAQATKSPDAVAVVFGDQQLTYRQLNRRANQVAHYLRKQGVEPDMAVGLCVERSVEMIVGILGILKAGGAYIPLDPEHPYERIGYMLADGQVSILLTQQAVLSQLPEHQAYTFLLDSDWHTLAHEDSQDPTHVVSPNNLAYLIYTSGSTGEPKGSMIEHKNVVNLVTGLHQRIYSQYPAGLRVALVAPYVFDASVQQIFGALLLGHSLHIVPEEARLNGKLLFEFYQAHQIDVSDGTPAHLDLISNSVKYRPRLGVRHFIIGGEALPPQTVAGFFGTFEDGSFKITNIYGPAECCVDSIAYEVSREAVEQLTTIPIGTPMPNQQIYILNEAKALQPLGMPGEICISGDNVGRGYLNRDQLTAERFVESPFLSGHRLYCTGDIGRYLSDGQIQFIGRRDTQVKIRGYRIELGEIENRLKQFRKQQEYLKIDLAQDSSPSPAQTPIRCGRCLLTTNHPGVQVDGSGICNVCRQFDAYGAEIRDYFRPFDEFKAVLEQARQTSQSEYDCLLLYSGGKDSSYVLYRLVEMGLKVLAYTFDNGFISAAAFKNIERMTSSLNVDTVVTQADAMNELFVESLMADSTVCSGCFRALTSHSTRLAQEKGINVVITGLSRGQIFDTKLANLFNQGIYDVGEIEEKLLLFRKMYHSSGDRTAKLLDDDLSDTPFDQMHFIDFFRYDDTPVHQIKAYLQARDTYWTQPQDTGFCSSNCMMNDIGIGVHTKDRGYHNYEAPLSWDIRLGIVTREDGLEEISYQLDQRRVNKVLDQIGYFTTRIRDAAVVDRVNEAGNKYLCAYYVATQTLTASELRAHLQETLPDYMIPNRFVRVDAIPLTHNGKVDRRALPVPDSDRPELDSAFVAPSNGIEETLADIWKETLKVERVGIHDNLFDLGGDSIISLQITTRANQAGLHLTPKQLFERQTIAELAAVAGTAQNAEAEQGLVTGSVPFTPIQLWFFDHELPQPDAWTMSLMVDVCENIKPDLLEQALQGLLAHHDVLRARFARVDGQAGWRQTITKDGPPPAFQVIDLSRLPESEQEARVAQTMAQVEAGHDLAEGRLIGAAYFEGGGHQSNRLFISVHHVAVDGFSWSILLEDLETAYYQLSRGEAISLPAKTISVKSWADGLAELAQSAEPRQELSHWLSVFDEVKSDIPVDNPGGANSEESTGMVLVSLDGAKTQNLLKEVPAAYNTQINDVLLTALAQTFSDWTDQPSLLIHLEGHGREDILENRALPARTVGWLTSMFPVKLTLPASTHPGERLKAIKEQLRAIPNKGVGYGLLRYLCRDHAVSRRLAGMPSPQLVFNYLGQLDTSLPNATLFRLSYGPTGWHGARNCRAHFLEIDSWIVGGQLHVSWTYSRNLHRLESIQHLAAGYVTTLEALIDHCLSAEAGGFTPSDFPLADLDEQKLDQLANILDALE
jgi:amino acid adenylation domain-containing protein/non-ribosomal peptide synthase protein (TIGR01720 family)